MSQPTDSTLVGLARAGDTRAFERLVERHAGLVYTIARSRLDSHESAEDLVQEVFIRVYLNLNRLGKPSRFAPWVAQMVRNLATDWQRRGWRRSQIVPMVPLGEEACRVSDLYAKGAREIMIADEQGRTLRRAINQLPTDQREVVLLHFGEDLKQSEIAERIGVRPSRVHRLLKRALAEMRQLVEGDLAEVDLREAVPALGVPRAVIGQTIALVTAMAAMSSTAKASLAVATAATQPAAASGLVSTIATKAVAGGTIMKISKGVAVLFLAAIGMFGYQEAKSEGAQAASKDAPREAAADAVTLRPCAESGTVWNYHCVGQVDQIMAVPFQQGGRIEATVETDGFVRISGPSDDDEMTHEAFETEREMTRLLIDGVAQAPGVIAEVEAAENPIECFISRVDALGVVTDTSTNRVGSPTHDQVIHDMAISVLSGFAEEPVSPGDTWAREVALPHCGDGVGRCVSTLERFEEIDGRLVAVISRRAEFETSSPVEITLPEAPGTTEMSSIQCSVNVEEQLFVDDGAPIRQEFEMTLQTQITSSIHFPDDTLESSTGVWKRISMLMEYETGS